MVFELTAVQSAALFLGLIWTVLNFYNFYPLAQGAVVLAVEYVRGSESRERPLEPEQYPQLDVFIPAYEEGDIIEAALSSIEEAGYPVDQLTTYVVVEPDDEETAGTLDGLADEYAFERLVVPSEYPGEPNKPRAINYAVERSAGELVGIIDAEDAIGEDLFDQVARAAVYDDADYMQGRPDMVNEEDGWLNLQFRAEYGYWYNLIVPARVRTGYPIPLSGNSCFFRRSVLIEQSERRLDRQGDDWTPENWAWAEEAGLSGIRPWDPRNVTEDFEIGLRLWEAGKKFSYLTAITKEESPPTLDGWIRQRTRWKKGKLYTGREFIRHPPAGIRRKFHFVWQSLLPHLGPVNISGLVLVLMIANLLAYRPGALVAAVLSLGATFGVGMSLFLAIGYWTVSDRPLSVKIRRAVIVALTLWLYWFLQWGADLRALAQFYAGRFHWEDTTHFGRHVGDRAESIATAVTDDYTLRQTVRLGGLAGIVAVGTGLRFVRLGDWSLWLDEIYTVAGRGALQARELLVIPSDPHPPLYYLFIHGWMNLFGRSAFVVRLPSVLASVATLIVVYRLGTRVYNDRVGLVAAGLLAVTPIHVHFARIARMYALFGLLTALSWYFFLSLSDESRWLVVGYVLATTALVYTHVFAGFIVLTQLLVVGLLGRDFPISGRRVAVGIVGTGLLSLPWLALFGWRVLRLLTGTGSGNIEWIPEPSSVAIARTALGFVGYPDYYPILASSTVTYALASVLLFAYVALLLASVVSIGVGGIAELRTSWYTGALGLWLTVPVIVPFLTSQLIPIYAPRYTFPASIPLFVLAARGIDSVPVRRLRTGLVVAVVVASLAMTGVYLNTDTAEDWQETTDRIERDGTASDLLVLQPEYTDDSIRFYYDGPRMDRVELRAATSEGEYQQLARQVADHDRIWLVSYFGTTNRTVEIIGANHTAIRTWTDGSITLTVYHRAPSADPSADSRPSIGRNDSQCLRSIQQT